MRSRPVWSGPRVASICWAMYSYRLRLLSLKHSPSWAATLELINGSIRHRCKSIVSVKSSSDSVACKAGPVEHLDRTNPRLGLTHHLKLLQPGISALTEVFVVDVVQPSQGGLQRRHLGFHLSQYLWAMATASESSVGGALNTGTSSSFRRPRYCSAEGRSMRPIS